jgi:CheY-like chemotaxis protein
MLGTSANFSTQHTLPNFGEARASEDLMGRVSEHRPQALVVDDNPDITDMLALFLHYSGYEVATASSAVTALNKAQAKHFDVIISDIGMPEMSGYELAQALRELPEYRTVPLVAVTGFAMYDDRDRALQAGFDAHLSKPIDPVTLAQIISHLRGR